MRRQRGGGDPQALGHGDVIFHAFIYGAAADHQHTSAAQILPCHVDAVLVLLRNLIAQEQWQKQRGADGRKARVIDRPAILGGIFGVLTEIRLRPLPLWCLCLRI